jgi:acetyl/propionyl-CoA carboxylase alpha subunit
MMKFQFDIAEQERTVEVQRLVHGHRVVVNGTEHIVDAVRVRENTWSLILGHPATGTLRSVEAIVVPQNGNGAVDVYIDGHRIEVAERSGLGRRTRGVAGTQGAGPQTITAPMPGKVVRVLVKAGDDVQPRQGLVVVEAMKMENELRAARAGRVRDVFVREGQSVEAGTPLVAVE